MNTESISPTSPDLEPHLGALSCLRERTNPGWADEFYEHMCNYERFQSAFMFWDASPRMIKAIILHPRLVIALHQKHVRSSKAYDPEVSEGELKLMLEDWNIPKDMVYTVDSNTLNSAVKSFEAGLTPMRAIQEHYAEVDDGEEVSFDDAIAIYGSSGTLLLVPLMAIAFALAFVVAILAAYNNGVAI